MTEQITMDNGPAPRVVDEVAEAKINEAYAQEIDRIRHEKAVNWASTDEDFFENMLAKERKLLQQVLTLEQLAALDREEQESAEE